MSYNPFSLAGKTILVTGASSGIGRSIAVECSKMGAKLVVIGRNKERLEHALNSMEGNGHIMLQTNLTSTDEIANMVNELPVLDGIVHNAGVNKRMVCQFIKMDDMHTILQTNLEAPILLQKLILKNKKIKKSASIIFLSSRAVFRPTIGNAIYSASKGAITSYSKVLALELAPRRIRVNCIHPGMVWTELLKNSSITQEQFEADEKKYPLGRYGKPKDVAFLAIYLLSDASVWMTGTSISIDGGGESLV